MATQEQVRNFLAHWFQLGKPVVLAGNQGECLPAPVFYQGGYSQAFEDCWQRIMSTGGEGCYLRGTTQSIATMLTPAWEVTACARCTMPVAIPTLGMMKFPCPCHDLYSWPNYEVPIPRSAVDDQQYLSEIQKSLNQLRDLPPPGRRAPYETGETNAFSSWRTMS
ncbi:MAG TPA: hypothetical protein IGR64_04505 [Leptolyngbyaceae cyanobacterium M65_K2018_010]|nr:hypothetical protein [Leptolyngbyaceae cyanobacterium M65_K2018_010]